MRESEIEKTVCNYAKNKGWLAYKFQSQNLRGVPDRMFLRDGITFFIEFKTVKGSVSQQQLLRQKELRNEGFITYIVNNIELGKSIIDNYTNVRHNKPE